MDHEVALRRMETLGTTLTTTESVIFEWCAQAGTDEFKAVRKLVMETPPQDGKQWELCFAPRDV